MEGIQTPDRDMVLSFAASPDYHADGTCFAARATGLYRSVDHGETWQFAYTSLATAPPTVAVAISPDFRSDRVVSAGVFGGILSSHDGGVTWNAVSLGAPSPLVSVLALSPNFSVDGTILAGTFEDGVLRSIDRGVTWTSANVGLLEVNILALAISPAFAKDSTAFVGAESGLFRSTNGGRSWCDIGFSTDFGPVVSLGVSRRFAQDRTIYAGTESAGLVQSRDAGISWTRLGEHAIVGEVSAILLGDNLFKELEVVVLHGGRIAVSLDGGETWSDHSSDDRQGAPITAIEATDRTSPTSSILVGFADGAVLTWQTRTLADSHPRIPVSEMPCTK